MQGSASRKGPGALQFPPLPLGLMERDRAGGRAKQIYSDVTNVSRFYLFKM
jgi:hypothetical protein